MAEPKAAVVTIPAVAAGEQKTAMAAPPSGTEQPQIPGPEKKKDTARLSLEEARPATVGAVTPSVQTVRLKKVGDVISEDKAGVPHPPVLQPETAAAATGIKSEKKSDTAKIQLESVIPPSMPAVGGDSKTVRIKKGPTAAAFVSTQPVVVPPEAPAAVAQGSGGVSTIKLKRPDGAALSDASFKGTETARISIEGIPAPQSSADAGGPRTVRIRRPGEPVAGPQTAGPITARKTMKISRPGQPAADQPPAAEGAGAESSPVTQRRTLSIKRQEAQVSERSARLAQEEIEVTGKLPGGVAAGKPERLAWLWCLVSLAAMAIIGVTIWMFLVQLDYRNQRYSWPGRVLGPGDSFYNNEREWL